MDTIRAHSRDFRMPIARNVGGCRENHQCESARGSHSGDGHGERLAGIRAGHPHNADEKKSETAKPQRRRSEERQIAMMVTPVGRITLFIASISSISDAARPESHRCLQLASNGVTSGFLANETRSLIWVAVAPVPVVPLVAVVLLGVRAIFAMLLDEISAVGVIFAVIPIVIVVMIRVIDSDLHGFLRCCRSSRSNHSTPGRQSETMR